jgi:hypothetical protein
LAIACQLRIRAATPCAIGPAFRGVNAPKFYRSTPAKSWFFKTSAARGRLAGATASVLGSRPRQEFPAADWIAVFAIIARGWRLKPHSGVKRASEWGAHGSRSAEPCRPRARLPMAGSSTEWRPVST